MGPRANPKKNTNVENRFIFLFLLCEALTPMIVLYFCFDHRQGMIDSGRLILPDSGNVERTSPKKEGELKA
jgi:hypothetical protein